ncbi:hypothetical protein [Brevundimonas sp. A19_0]|uniref:hypothetical protein n=1 Tax=Brevundimonas sp. A19_0 TaxID=2821087 RepID=UPI001ADB4ACC|nr:hypothetical protein [Brevundimonas sp. A19_0]MBO9501389.1 hypothetical protein [Brevundimonas sp. A19_0]
METDAELLEVADSFQISGVGLIVVPDFSVPETGWQTRTLAARVLRPDGTTLGAVLGLQVSHFNVRDPSAPLDRRWRVVPTFHHLTKDEVPIGSRIFVELDVVTELSPATS